MKVGLLGGTFDPVHNGHVSIAKSFLESAYIDELWILLTPFPPHKLDSGRISYINRLEMLTLAFKDFENLRISTLENELPEPSYTVNTIRDLKKTYQDYEFLYCLGEDSLSKFHTWKYYDEILSEAKILVTVRPGYNHDNVISEILERAIFVEHQPIKISSSEIKNRVKDGKEIVDLVPQNVDSFIKANNLYK